MATDKWEKAWGEGSAANYVAHTGPRPPLAEVYPVLGWKDIIFATETNMNKAAKEADALMLGFSWGDTVEGIAFWSDIHNRLRALSYGIVTAEMPKPDKLQKPEAKASDAAAEDYQDDTFEGDGCSLYVGKLTPEEAQAIAAEECKGEEEEYDEPEYHEDDE
jgi:hypothetical protein